MSNAIARGTIGLILGSYIAAIISLVTWPTFVPGFILVTLSLGGIFVGGVVSLLTHKENWLIFGITTGAIVGLASGVVTTVIFWVNYGARAYGEIEGNPGIDILKGTFLGLLIGLIAGGVAGYIINFIFSIPSRNSLDTPSLGSQRKNYVPEGIAKILILLLSFFISIGGIVIGLQYLKRPDLENQRFAKQVFIATGAGYILSVFYPLLWNGIPR